MARVQAQLGSVLRHLLVLSLPCVPYPRCSPAVLHPDYSCIPILLRRCVPRQSRPITLAGVYQP